VAATLATLAAGLAELMYRTSPALTAVALLALAFLAIAAWKPIIGLYAAVLAIPLEAVGVSVGNANATPAKALLDLLAIVILAHLLLGQRRAHIRAAHAWFGGVILVSLLGVAFAPDTSTLLQLTAQALAYVIISIFVTGIDRDEIERLLQVLVFSGAVAGLVTVLTTGPQVATEGGRVVTGRAQAGFAHPNVLAFFLQLTLGPALVMLRRPQLAQRLAVSAAVGMMIAGLALTLSRAAFLGTAVMLIILLASSPFRRLAAALAVIVVVLAVTNFDNILSSSEISQVSQRISTVSSVQGVGQDPRVAIWSVTPRIVADHFVLGVGEGNFYTASVRYGVFLPDHTPFDHAHNLFLTVAAELGLVGLAIFGGFLIAVGRAAWRGLRARGRSGRLVLACVASLVGLLATSVAEYPPRTEVILATTLVLVGVILALDPGRGLNAADTGLLPSAENSTRGLG
jgi:O-antigen ligase